MGVASGIYVLGSAVASAQPADTLVTEAATLAFFENARALAVDPAGRLYIADAGEDVIVQLDADGQLLAYLGGPGTREGEFAEPSDIDPTNGLVLVVADAGNSRLQRFSKTFLFLEALPVTRAHRFTPGGAPRTDNLGDEGSADGADGRPIAVETSVANEIFAIDEAEGVVLKWDASRRFERVIGGFDAGAGALEVPVALATDRQRLFVADRGLAAVVVYDLFGGYIGTLAPGRADDVRALAVRDDALWIVLPERLLVYETRGRLRRTLDVRLGEPLIDVALRGRIAYLLTPTRLLATRL